MSGTSEQLCFREGRASDLRSTFAISAHAVHHTATKIGVLQGAPPTTTQVEAEWAVQREVVEFVAAQPVGSYWICEDDGRPVGYGRVCRFARVEQLTELMVLPSHHGRGIGRALLERCFPGEPAPELDRIVIAAGATSDLTLYTDFGVMPVSGHWHLRARARDYAERRAREIDATGPAVHALEPVRARAEWKALEPGALGHHRPELHDFLARTRTCLGTMDADTGGATGLCWVGRDGDIGPAVATTPADLVPVVLAALDRVARTREPQSFGVYCGTDSWLLVSRLRRLGFRVHWPGWVMSSVPLPGLDRYMPMRPPHLL
ncbi:MAG: GNAT family N-acetyltransferase [Thermoleophilaceae bacterium]